MESNVKGERVRLVHDPGRVGVLTGREQMRGQRRMLQVDFPEGTEWKPEDQIQSAKTRMSPLDILETGALGSALDLRRALTHAKLSGRLANVVYSMEATRTDFYAYQFKPVLKILQSPTNSLLVADEVGLGKTIEAGLVWTELRARMDLNRLLVLCPAALREKWRFELSTKMGVDATIVDAKEALATLREVESHDRGFALIASMQGLRPPKEWEGAGNAPTAQLARFLRSMENAERLVDLLVVDEAHHMRTPGTKTQELGSLMRGVSEYCVLLSATPVHNRSTDLHSLLQMLDPGTFTQPFVLEQILQANRPLVRARDMVLSPRPDPDALRRELEMARSSSLLAGSRQLATIVQSGLTNEVLQNPVAKSRLAYDLESVNLLSHVLTRTRKRDVTEWRVVREPKAHMVPLHDVERRYYNLVSDVVVEYALEKRVSEGFLLSQPQRQMTSSMAASLRSWQSQMIGLDESEEMETDEVPSTATKELGPLVTEIVRRSHHYVDLGDLIAHDSKYECLRDILREFISRERDEKIVVFSSFRSTLSYLDERLGADGIESIVLMGGQRETKAEVIERFQASSGARVLLSSEVGGEGVDLQFCRIVINYDLPWNPMRVEQRIGRVDRLGQEADKVFIWNIFYDDTIDARVYRRLYEKLDLCRDALGDFEAILGAEIRNMTIDLLSGRLSPEQQERRIDQTVQALENLRHEERKLEDEAASLVAYGDYILNEVRAARALNRWISGGDIYRYVTDYLGVYYPGCEFRQVDGEQDVFDVRLSSEARHDLSDFVESSRMRTATRLHSPSHSHVLCRFESRTTDAYRGREELVSQFHPLVKMIREQIGQGDEQLTPAVAVRLGQEASGVELAPGIYLLAVSLWSFSGLQQVERLAYAALSLDAPDVALEPTTSEALANAASRHGVDWLEGRALEDMERVYELANGRLLAMLDEAHQSFVQDLVDRNHDRADVQLRTIESHSRHQLGTLEDVRIQHVLNGRDPLAKATEGRMRALKERADQQRRRIESGRSATHDSKETAVALILLA